MSDHEVIRLVLDGQRDLYRMLVERYQQIVFRTCMGFVHDKDDADDLTQEVFIQAYQSLSTFRREASFATWLYRIAINASLNKVRKSSRNSLFRLMDSLSGADRHMAVIPDMETEDPEKIIIRREHHEWIQRALDSLPENQRTAIVLSKYENLSQKEIAVIMNTTEGAVEALIQRAKANLRMKLDRHNKKIKKRP